MIKRMERYKKELKLKNILKKYNNPSHEIIQIERDRIFQEKI